LNDSEQAISALETEFEVNTSYYGVLAGLTFAASIFAFQFRTSLPLGDIFLTLTLATSVLFVLAATANGDASNRLRNNDKAGAIALLGVGDDFGRIALLVLLFDIDFIGFSVGLLQGFILLVVIVVGFIYFLKRSRMNKDVKSSVERAQ
jgi:hypothetical protein